MGVGGRWGGADHGDDDVHADGRQDAQRQRPHARVRVSQVLLERVHTEKGLVRLVLGVSAVRIWQAIRL